MDDNKNINTEDMQAENDDIAYVEAAGLFKDLENEIVEENAERERKTAETFNELLGAGVTVPKKPRTAQINAANTKISKAELVDMVGENDDDVDIDESNIISAKAFVPADKSKYKPDTVPGGTAVKNDATADKKNKKGKKPVRHSGNQNKMNILFIIIMLIGVILFIVAISGIVKAASGGMAANIQSAAVAADIGYVGAFFINSF